MKKMNLFRKMAVMTAFTLLGTSAMAEDYHYLTFETEKYILFRFAKAKVRLPAARVVPSMVRVSEQISTEALAPSVVSNVR